MYLQNVSDILIILVSVSSRKNKKSRHSYGKRYIDKAFAITFDIIKLALFISVKEINAELYSINPHIRQNISHQPQTTLRISVVYFSIDIILINPFRQKFTDNEVYFTIIGIISKPLRYLSSYLYKYIRLLPKRYH